ncbi:hypothetical protein [Pseudoxanthomonas sp.]|jgi:hypothetical protein|uniref:hypothetical protein n=1 Tax=Pseudoxanthomonas sp. TaxID=1871049 RepID=UPI002E0E8A23|nr:hypothetical protein [Pseudoxanthomonas sp.]
MRCFLLPALLALSLSANAVAADDGRAWQPGDHHVHSEWSVDWDRTTSPPTPIRGGDSPYTRSRNARQALAYGLTWMVHTDHGGPGHSTVTRDHAWPALEQARRDVPALIQFNGMEFDVPAAEHASLIIAPGAHERDELVDIERRFSRNEPVEGVQRDDAQIMLAALAHMRGLPAPPLMVVNHPSRTATGVGQWGDVEPDELRAWHDAAPRVLVGMEGAPGHQAIRSERGLYRNRAAPTFGGFDQMTTQVGGVWDTLLAEGRRFWITATSDSHHNLRDGGRDYDPGEYSKTYVRARRDAGDILDGLRHGRMFAVTGDLIDALELTVRGDDAAHVATLGETLALPVGSTMRIELRVRQPSRPNANGERPALAQMELIVGSPGDAGTPVMQTRHWRADAWRRDGDMLVVTWNVPVPARGAFVRARGSSTLDTTPPADVPGEDPWQDLWFYSNPVFIEAGSAAAPSPAR